MVPNGWKKGSISSLVNTVMGYAFKSSDFVESGIPLVRMGNLYQNQFQLDRGPKYLPESYADEYKRFILKPGDLIMSMTGTMGKRDYGFTVEIPADAPYCLLNQRVLKIEPKKEESKNFILNLMKSEYVLSRMYSLPGGTKQANLSSSQINEISVLIPPVSEQKKIGEILTTWDKAIDTTERLINNSKQQKKALMQQLLTGKKRLLDDNGKRFEGEWEESRIGDFGEIYSGGTPSTTKSTYWDGDIDWITPTDITKQDKRYINSSKRRITKEGLKNSSAKLVPAGSLLICTRATIGAMAITSHAMCTNQGFKNIVPNDDYDIEFIYYLLSFNPNQLIRRASGSTFLELSKSEFEAIKFKTPQLKEQQKIAAVLTNADKEIELLEQQLADLQQEKKALMQVLLTGKKRVLVDR